MEKAKLESRVLEFIKRHNLVPPGETVVVGVSGGADSACLLHILARWQDALRIRVHAAHLNHQLRGAESEADAQYVLALARSLSIPVTIDKEDVSAYRMARKCSIEEAARELRYGFLARVAMEVGASRIAVGHTRDDQVETILMHILRGSGITGLAGLAPSSPMPTYRGDGEGVTWPSSLSSRAAQTAARNLLVIRPLLDVTREETTGYCQQHQLNPRIDSSNLSLSFFRNRLRLELLPLLRQYNPVIDQALLRLADIAREDSAFIEQEARRLWDEVAREENGAIYLDRERIAGLPIALQRQLLRDAVAKLVRDSRDIEAVHIEAARGLLSKRAGSRICLPRGVICQAVYNELVVAVEGIGPQRGQLQFPGCPFPELLGEFRLLVPGETILSGWKVLAAVMPRAAGQVAPKASKAIGQKNLTAYFDLRKTGTELFVRRRRRGDRFQPLGMHMPKKLYEFMVDAKIPGSWRDNIPIVCSPQHIIWVVGWRIDDRVKVTEASEEVLRLEFIRLE